MPAIFTGRTIFKGSLLALLGSVLLLRCDGAGDDPSDDDAFGEMPLHETQKIVAAIAAGGFFGVSVAVDGGVAVVGAQGGHTMPGAAYVFEVSGGVWTEVTRLTASDGRAGDGFGFSVAISGDRAIVGRHASYSGSPGPWVAYVFERIGEVWSEVAILTASDAQIAGLLGVPVAISGNVAVVGVEDQTPSSGGIYAGAAYVFEIVGGVWTEVVQLTASDARDFDAFGKSVAISGDVVIVGTNGGQNKNQSGAAYVFESSGGIWSEVAILTASDADAQTFDTFGREVAISGNVVVVGDFTESLDGTLAGAAYVFESVGGMWTEVAKLTASDAQTEAFFGSAVAFRGNEVVVGAAGHDGGGSAAGAAYIFESVGGVWTEVVQLTASDAQGGDYFGEYVAASGGVIIVGVPGITSAGVLTGKAYIFQ